MYFPEYFCDEAGTLPFGGLMSHCDNNVFLLIMIYTNIVIIIMQLYYFLTVFYK